MPGYLINQASSADIISYTPQGSIESTTVQEAIQELSADILSVEGIALLGL